MNHFIVHRYLSRAKDAMQIQDMLDETLSMAAVDAMEFKGTVQFTDAEGLQHLYLIFDRLGVIDSMLSPQQRKWRDGEKIQKASRKKSRKT